MRFSPEYLAWSAMIQRCHCPSNKTYRNYGARGIVVCDRWRNSFLAFLADMGRRPSPDLSLDRIDNNGNYEPGNCRWATRDQQLRNRRTSRMMTVFGETKPANEWAKDPRCVVSWWTVYCRLRAGWNDEAAITTPALTARESGRRGARVKWDNAKAVRNVA